MTPGEGPTTYATVGTEETQEQAVEETVEETQETQEQAVEEEISEEEVAEFEEFEESQDDDDTSAEVYSEDDLLKALAIQEMKFKQALREKESGEELSAETAAKERQPQQDPKEYMNTILEETFGGIDDEEMITGANLKTLLGKFFGTVQEKTMAQALDSEAQIFNEGANHYKKTYVPAIINKLKIDPRSRDAEYVAISYNTLLNAAQEKYGKTTMAAQQASTQHMLLMKKKFSPESSKPVVRKAAVEKRISSTGGGDPRIPKPQVTTVSPEVEARLKSGKASTAEILRIVNKSKPANNASA